MLKLIRYFKKLDVIYAICVICLAVISVWLSLSLPGYMTNVTQLVTTGGAMNEIWMAGLMMLLCALGDVAANVLAGYFTARLSSSFSANLREQLYTKVVGFSMEEISRFSTSSLVTRSTNDVAQITMVIGMGLQVIMKAPIIAIWAFCKIVGKGSNWLIVTGIAVFLVVCVVLSNIMLVIPKFRKIQKLTDDLNLVSRENLTGVRVVRAYNAEQYQEKKFGVANKALADNHLYTGKIMAYMNPSMTFIMSTTSLMIYWVGAYMINAADPGMERITIFSNQVTFMAYAVQIIMAFMMVSMIFIFLPRAMVSAARINEVLETEPKINDGKGDQKANNSGRVEFKNVCFAYPDAQENVLSDITFTAEPGETIAVIGSTGSGKSTLVNLIPRFYDITSGEVLVDDVDVRNYVQNDLRKRIGYVSQRATLFKGTLRYNIDYGNSNREVTDDDIKHALEIAQGIEILDKSEKGIDMEVSQSGQNFSGGQKQRISIARAICKKPEIFIFDDSFSALDYKTDKVLRAALRKEIKDATCIVVAQRIGTVKDADKILVLDEGRLVGLGKHKDLLENCEVYRQIAYSQLSEEELKNA